MTIERCEVCGQGYHRLMRVEQDGRAHWFDSFQCAISRMAPACAQCGVKVLGQGVSREGDVFCCEGCAESAFGRRRSEPEETVNDYA